MRKIAVGDVMTRSLVTASSKDSLHHCAKLMSKKRIDVLPITHKKKLVGLLTSRDVLWTITKKPKIDLREINVMQIATRKVAVIKPSADISEAINKMKSLNFRRLPVLSKGELIGIVTIKDILSLEPTIQSDIQELLEIREEKEKLKQRDSYWPEAGLCDSCGSFSDLTKVGSQLLCSDCRAEVD